MVYEALNAGRDDWHFSSEYDTFSPSRAAELFASEYDLADYDVVQVRKKGGGRIFIFYIAPQPNEVK